MISRGEYVCPRSEQGFCGVWIQTVADSGVFRIHQGEIGFIFGYLFSKIIFQVSDGSGTYDVTESKYFEGCH